MSAPRRAFAHLDVGPRSAVPVHRTRWGPGVRGLRDHDLPRAAAWADRMAALDVRLCRWAPIPCLLPQCAAAFGVGVRGHRVAGVAHPFYSFEQLP